MGLSLMPQLVLLELNEINFDLLRWYARRGDLPNLANLVERYGVIETTSESQYEHLEPWIQWVTAHTGLSLAQHGIFRLGDVVNHEIAQIWEVLERHGLNVGAVSPMNAKNCCRNPAFFVPDPWTRTRVVGRPALKRLYDALSQAVNDNAKGRLTLSSAAWLAVGTGKYARMANYWKYVRLGLAGRSKPWSKAILLDLLLTDIFVSETRRTKPAFASLFLNAGAHIQHHYMFNSPAYRGGVRNPEWYIAGSIDPVLDVYRAYDEIVGQIAAAFPETRLMLATGLHQDFHDELTFYWRLKDHTAFLRHLDIPFLRVYPRMSRDFLVACASRADAKVAAQTLASVKGEDGQRIFEVDNRGTDLFVMLTYPHDIRADFECVIGDKPFRGLADSVVFVAIKNGKHNGIGYFVDTGRADHGAPERFPLEELPARICAALGVEWGEPMGGLESTAGPSDLRQFAANK